MATKKPETKTEKKYLFFDDEYLLYLEGTEKEFLEDVVRSGEYSGNIYYKIDPIHIEKIRVESKIVKI